ncbi:hypothetical protein BDW22DRAFT_1349781 [Trametopsis cervina]|nr:hypothetical protein BDW22DRAFT_1349781 [Trametopsis cervina]
MFCLLIAPTKTLRFVLPPSISLMDDIRGYQTTTYMMLYGHRQPTRRSRPSKLSDLSMFRTSTASGVTLTSVHSPASRQKPIDVRRPSERMLLVWGTSSKPGLVTFFVTSTTENASVVTSPDVAAMLDFGMQAMMLGDETNTNV